MDDWVLDFTQTIGILILFSRASMIDEQMKLFELLGEGEEMI